MIHPGWQIAGGLIAAIGIALSSFDFGVKTTTDKYEAKLQGQTVAELREDLRRVSAINRQTHAARWMMIQFAIAEDARRANERPRIEIRWRTFTQTLEMSDDEILDARLPADVSHEFGCLFDDRPGTGECDGDPHNPTAGSDGRLTDIGIRDAGTPTEGQ
ncbi:MAG: hypothetical protein AAF926_04565 [Pseudomonadota bacterium]